MEQTASAGSECSTKLCGQQQMHYENVYEKARANIGRCRTYRRPNDTEEMEIGTKLALHI